MVTSTVTAIPAPASVNDRMAVIASAIRAEMSPVMDTDAVKSEAASALSDARDGAINVREAVMQKLAAVAQKGNWTEIEITRAVKFAAASSNADLPKSVVTFMDETRKAMHPQVRPRFAQIVATRNAVWQAEDEAREIDKGAFLPVRHAFKRKYHTLVELMRCAEKGQYHDAVSFVAYAEARNPDLDPGRQAKAVEAAMENLQAILARFPDTELALAVDALGKVTKDTLALARREHHTGEDEVTAKAVANTLASVPTVPTTVVDTAGTADIVEGVVDPLDVFEDA